MRQVNPHGAKIQLSRLVPEAVAGKGFVIGKAGKPLVRATRLEGDAEPAPPRQLFSVPPPGSLPRAPRAEVPGGIKAFEDSFGAGMDQRARSFCCRRRPLDRGALPSVEPAIALLVAQVARRPPLAQGSSNTEDGQWRGNRSSVF